MLPFRTNVTIFIVEFLCAVLLHAFYVYSNMGPENAFYVALGLVPVLLVFLISLRLTREKLVIRCLMYTGVASFYYICTAAHTEAMLVFMLLVMGIDIALFLDQPIIIEYFGGSTVLMVILGIFRSEAITEFFPMTQYVAYLTMYAFSGVAMVFITYSINRYKVQMEEKNEIAREALEAKSNFLANMSHEIRTPMNAIYGIAEIMEGTVRDKGQQEYIMMIKRSSENLLYIINEILDFSKVDAGKLEIVDEPYNFNEMLQDVVTMMELRAREKNLQLRLDMPRNIPKLLGGDEKRVRQILINIMNNAIKFTNRGSVTLKVTWEEAVGFPIPQGTLTMKVIDTGIGIAKENMSMLFTAFGQVNTKKNRNVEGTGLGLAICKNLTDEMGGVISVESELNKGSVFTVAIPQKIIDEAPDDYEIKRLDNIIPGGGYSADFVAPKARVLVVDDNKVNLQVAHELLKLFGIEAKLACSGQEAIDLVSRHLISYDIIFMDHMMPYIDGAEATQRIRSMDSEYARKVPIIALTANAIKGVDKQLIAAGMNDYISKPIKVAQLGDVLKKWLPSGRVFPAGTSMEDIERAEKNKPWDELPMEELLERFEGIDTDTGIRNCAGNVKGYIELLKTYAVSNLGNLLDEYFESEDMENYAVTAHSIKGASQSVGALDVADMAYSLERAAKRGDITYIWDQHEELIDHYTEILLMLRQIFYPEHRQNEERAVAENNARAAMQNTQPIPKPVYQRTAPGPIYTPYLMGKGTANENMDENS